MGARGGDLRAVRSGPAEGGVGHCWGAVYGELISGDVDPLVAKFGSCGTPLQRVTLPSEGVVPAPSPGPAHLLAVRLRVSARRPPGAAGRQGQVSWCPGSQSLGYGGTLRALSTGPASGMADPPRWLSGLVSAFSGPAPWALELWGGDRHAETQFCHKR